MFEAKPILTTYGELIIEELRFDIKSKPVTRFGSVNASGRLADSLRFEVNGDTLKIYAVGYAEFVERGRRPGKRPPIAAIEQWISDKGIIPDGISRRSLAYLVARKIGMEGTEIYRQGGTQLFTDVFNEVTELIKQELIRQTTIYLIGQTKNALAA